VPRSGFNSNSAFAAGPGVDRISEVTMTTSPSRNPNTAAFEPSCSAGPLVSRRLSIHLTSSVHTSRSVSLSLPDSELPGPGQKLEVGPEGTYAATNPSHRRLARVAISHVSRLSRRPFANATG